ncbi:50S ribosomal protein L10 [bacterium]|jgi:large subunit ribosomal protein L10|nr:50S ribosomal protein L10 [bacterium]MBT4648993.1 50S ribosomal protein L10 [bacterium]
MPKTKEQKKEALKSIQDKLNDSKSVVFSSDNGLGVKTAEDLRKELKKVGGEYLVVKKTLLKKVLAEMEGSDQINDLSGSVALSFSYDDEVAAASVLNKFSKGNETLSIGGGILENKLILPEMVKRLATLPSKEELLSKVVGSLQAPISGMVNVLHGNLRNLVGVLSAIKDNKPTE